MPKRNVCVCVTFSGQARIWLNSLWSESLLLALVLMCKLPWGGMMGRKRTRQTIEMPSGLSQPHVISKQTINRSVETWWQHGIHFYFFHLMFLSICREHIWHFILLKSIFFLFQHENTVCHHRVSGIDSKQISIQLNWSCESDQILWTLWIPNNMILKISVDTQQ